MTDQPEITPPAPDPDSDVLTDEELAAAGATAEDAEPITGEDDA